MDVGITEMSDAPERYSISRTLAAFKRQVTRYNIAPQFTCFPVNPKKVLEMKTNSEQFVTSNTQLRSGEPLLSPRGTITSG